MSTKDMLEKHRLLAVKTLDNSLFNLLERALSEIRCFELSKGGNYKATEEEVQGILPGLSGMFIWCGIYPGNSFKQAQRSA